MKKFIVVGALAVAIAGCKLGMSPKDVAKGTDECRNFGGTAQFYQDRNGYPIYGQCIVNDLKYYINQNGDIQ